VPGQTPKEFLPGAGWGMFDPVMHMLVASGIVILLASLVILLVLHLRRRRRLSQS